jgi:surfeit locus 1 family protein
VTAGAPGAAAADPTPSDVESSRSPWASLVFVLLLAALASAFAGLGAWQVQRRAWKLGLIARVDARVHASPVPAPGPAAWPRVSDAQDGYRHVEADGVYDNGRETTVQALTDLGAGYWVLTPFATRQGFTILVNRGFVTPEHAAASTRAPGEIEGPTRVVGLLRISEPHGGFLRANDPAHDRWYSRDVAAIARARGFRRVAPYFIDAGAVSRPQAPVGGLTVIRFPNSHLVYALTWFSLALMSAAGAVRVGWGALSSRRPRPED